MPEWFPHLEPTGQRSFTDMGTPLHDVTFVVVDVETTGGSPATCAITEIGAVKYRGGECLGTFQTLINPGVPIPPTITVLTGITEAMVLPAPRIADMLPHFLEFLGPPSADRVLAGHNVRFDAAFLDAALTAHGYDRLRHTRVDTVGLARRLVRDEVPNLRLGTLARHFRAHTEPNHRAFDDAKATLEVLHALLERAGTLGVLGLDDLVALPTMRAHPSSGKLALTARLPRTPGVYLFKDRGGRVLYVGKATNVRSRVRSYFSGDDRRKVPQLLREVEAIDVIPCRHPLEAAVREIRLIHEHEPRFNRQAKAWRSYSYLKLTLQERFPRLAVVREAKPDGARYLGPFRSSRAAHAVREAIESAVPLRRCTRRVGRTAEVGGEPCLPAVLGAAACPCSGACPAPDYDAIVKGVVRGLSGEPAALLDPLEARMHALAHDERFEEAALTRDRLAALSRALERERLVGAARGAGWVVVDDAHGTVEIDGGRLAGDLFAPPPSSPEAPPARDEIDELLVVARFLFGPPRGARTVRRADGLLASVLPALPRYDPAPSAATAGRGIR
ncbi:MAG: DEDD exonuclease domain-containing protein [Actinobacteria bacterium]|nr:DEDD exonuclease domain-containing protein [Actinomycetota bacterium]